MSLDVFDPNSGVDKKWMDGFSDRCPCSFFVWPENQGAEEAMVVNSGRSLVIDERRQITVILRELSLSLNKLKAPTVPR